MKLLQHTDLALTARQFSGKVDFDEYVTGDVLTTVASDSGAIVANDEAGGTITIQPSDGTVADNDETYVKGTREIFKFAADKPFQIMGRLKFTEANTDDANVIFGVMDAVGANALLDDGGGPKASYSGAVFFKVDGGTAWQCESSIGGSQVTTQTTVAAGGGVYQKLSIDFMSITSTKGVVQFFIDDVFVAKHDISFGSATEMQLVVGAKNGSANHEQPTIDYIVWEAVR